MNYRGIEVELNTPRTYCATNFEDLDMVVKHIHKKYETHKIFAIGTSLGGIMLGGYLSKQYDDCLISNAMIVSAPMNIIESCQEMEKKHYLYTFNRFLTCQLRKYLHQ
jgi:predicted alpha/beta-fold hydrolase